MAFSQYNMGKKEDFDCKLMFSTLGKIFSRRHLNFCLYFFQKTNFDMETICMKCQILFSGKKYEKMSSICHLSPESPESGKDSGIKIYVVNRDC